MERNKHSIE